MTDNVAPEIKFIIGKDAMGRMFNQAIALRIQLAEHVRDSTRPRVDEMFSMMSMAASIAEGLQASIKEQMPEAKSGD